MIDFYNDTVFEYKDYIENKTQYYEVNPNLPLVVKGYNLASSRFPIIAIQQSNITFTDFCTNDKIEKYDEMFITIDIYTKDKTINNQKIASQVINDELTSLTLKFFEYKNFKVTMCRPTPNMDNSILRRTIQLQGLVGNARNNIIRR